MRKSLGALMGLMCAIGAGAALAEPDDAQRLAAAVAPFVDNQTVAVVHVDLGGIDAVESITLLAKLFGLNERQHANLQGAIAPLGVLPTGGAADVFAVVSMSDLRLTEPQNKANGGQPAKAPGLPFFLVISVADGAPGSAIAAELKRDLGPGVMMETIGQSIVLASERTLDRLKSRPAQPRPEIAAALRALDGGAAHFLLVPPREARQLVELMWPRLPESLGGGPTKAFTQGVVWAAVGIDLPPAEPELRVAVQSTSAEAAATLEREVAALAKKLGEEAEVREAVPDFDELWKRLAPRAEGDLLLATLNEQHASLAEYAKLLEVLLRTASGGAASRAK